MALTQEEKNKRMEQRRFKKWNETHRIIDDKEYKICSICHEWFPSTEEYFYKNNSSMDGLAPYCKSCNSNKSVNWQIDNHKKYLKGRRNWYKKNRDERIEYRREWTKENQEHINKYQSNWQNDNKNKLKEYENKRKNKNHIISRKEWLTCKEYFNNSCAYCGMTYEKHKNLYNQDLHKEHVEPNGSVYLDNCVPSCRNCNSSKSEYQLNEWYDENNPNFSQERLIKIQQWLNEDYKLYFEGYREKQKKHKRT